MLFEKGLLAFSEGLLQGNATLFAEEKHPILSACATFSRDNRQRKCNILCTS